MQILSVFGNAAVVRIDAQEWVDYLQQIKWNGSWKIIQRRQIFMGIPALDLVIGFTGATTTTRRSSSPSASSCRSRSCRR